MWMLLALAAAALWGLQYALWGELLKTFTPAATMFFYNVFATVIFGAVWWLKDGGAMAGEMSFKAGTWLAVCIAIGVMANLGIITSIGMKNATMAAMVEASYPLFTALFAFFLFRENQLNATAVLGFGVVLVGLGLIAYSEAS